MQLKTISAFRAGLLTTGFCLIVSSTIGYAGEAPLRDLLRDGLFAEEVSRDPDAAAKQYEELLARYSEEGNFAASALFRLAEVRRKQDRKDDAIKLYQRLLLEFPTAANETKLARENLLALGAKPAEAKADVKPRTVDLEAQEMTRLQTLAKTSPDSLVDPLNFRSACGSGWTRVMRLMLDAGCDPFTGDVLQDAARSGNLEVVRMLLAENKPVPGSVARAAFESAIDSSRLAVLKYLLEKGLRPEALQGPGGEIPPLLYALRTGNLKAAEVLVEGGEELDAVSEFRIPNREGVVRGRALHFAILSQKYESAAWLLKKGAKPEVPGTGETLTPLLCALDGSEEDCLPLIEALLAAGADANAEEREKGKSALAIAISSKFKPEEKTDLLLKHGAKPAGLEKQLQGAVTRVIKEGKRNMFGIVGKLIAAGASARELNLLPISAYLTDLSLAKLLLDHGADPQGGDEVEGFDPPLAVACEKVRPDLLKLLLDAGVDPRGKIHKGQGLIQLVSQNELQDRAVECLTLLADAGVLPEARWANEGYQQAKAGVMPVLIERFAIPDLAARGGVGFVLQTAGNLDIQRISDGSSVGKPPQLERWLLAQGPRLAFVKTDESILSAKYRWQLWRRGDGGKFLARELDFSGGESFPDLLAGDVVLCRLRLEGAGAYEYVRGLPPDMELALRKRISFPITIEHQGKNRGMTMRGDRVIFDPTKDELPLASAQDVVAMLWQTADYPEVKPGMMNQTAIVVENPSHIVIHRKDWPEVRLQYGSREADGFQLEAGDHLKVEFSEDFLQGMERFREDVVTLRLEGHPLTRRYGVGDRRAPGILAPTLIQALVDMQVPRDLRWREWAGRDKLDALDLAGVPRVFRDFTLLPHPDLSRISIRRLQEGGTEKVIDVDLTKAISSMTDGMTAGEARKLDVDLQAGDIVDIRLKEEKLGEPWKGFDEREIRFFNLVLSGQVQVVDGQGGVSFSAIDIRPLNYVATDLGLLPVPSEKGQPSPRAWWFLNGGTSEAVTRGGIRDDSNPQMVFLRGGDELRLMDAPSHPSVPPVRRIVPPTSK
ncbi:tetratricopeptide repeat protein [Luteolibacter yonseiensis]|uniref:Tetratricopeptide repeat protein n=1 Tax=Luteolibacter yonseiensis TaxID=1144680 RepID=A0A934RA86_9BACT|nr:ankyrin repeat domain-containing protein [Luteolibacter yonseiensis]MBK1818370.1 tetratricopeptide repeat protein [Luteolibacter yonseiensis]